MLYVSPVAVKRMTTALNWEKAANKARCLCRKTRGREGRFISLNAAPWILKRLKERGVS